MRRCVAIWSPLTRPFTPTAAIVAVMVRGAPAGRDDAFHADRLPLRCAASIQAATSRLDEQVDDRRWLDTHEAVGRIQKPRSRRRAGP